jgi:hypothetical protein
MVAVESEMGLKPTYLYGISGCPLDLRFTVSRIEVVGRRKSTALPSMDR